MKCAYTMRGGYVIAVDGEIVTSKGFLQNEIFTMKDILAIRYFAPTAWKQGSFKILTRKEYLKQKAANVRKWSPYFYSFTAGDAAFFEQFFQEFLNEIRLSHGSEGTLVDGWWTWPVDEAPASAEQKSIPSGAAPTNAPAPAAPTEPTVAPSEAAEIEEKRKNGPACPDCGCASIFADKDDGGVIITCLNCGRQWRPGEHRSW